MNLRDYKFKWYSKLINVHNECEPQLVHDLNQGLKLVSPRVRCGKRHCIMPATYRREFSGHSPCASIESLVLNYIYTTIIWIFNHVHFIVSYAI